MPVDELADVAREDGDEEQSDRETHERSTPTGNQQRETERDLDEPRHDHHDVFVDGDPVGYLRTEVGSSEPQVSDARHRKCGTEDKASNRSNGGHSVHGTCCVRVGGQRACHASLMTIDAATHRALAIEANNSTWEILRQPQAEITDDAAEEMTRRAYAAAYHWQRAERSTPANEARASWLLSRVWAVRGVGAVALAHAERCAAVCRDAGLVDFDLAYAHEALARANACLGNTDEALRHRALARAIAVNDAEDKRVVDSDLDAEPWFGLPL